MHRNFRWKLKSLCISPVCLHCFGFVCITAIQASIIKLFLGNTKKKCYFCRAEVRQSVAQYFLWIYLNKCILQVSACTCFTKICGQDPEVSLHLSFMFPAALQTLDWECQRQSVALFIPIYTRRDKS